MPRHPASSSEDALSYPPPSRIIPYLYIGNGMGKDIFVDRTASAAKSPFLLLPYRIVHTTYDTVNHCTVHALTTRDFITSSSNIHALINQVILLFFFFFLKKKRGKNS